MIKKKISVIMSYYNSEKYLKESINSILEQTYQNFELILLNDGSSDSGKSIVESYNDRRIVLLNNKKNLGVPKSFNKMIEHATGEYIAFMDSDDISIKERLGEQINFLEKNNYAMCGSCARQFGNNRNKNLLVLENLIDLKTLIIIGNPIINSTVMIKTNILKKFKCNHKYISWDFDLHARLILQGHKVANLNKILLYSRSHNQQDSIVNFKIGISDSYNISKNYFNLQKDLFVYKKYLNKSKLGYCEKISFNDYKYSILAFKRLINFRKNDYSLLNIFNKNLILKINPINIVIYLRLLKINDKLCIKLELKHKILLLIRALFNINNQNFSIKFLFKIYYFITYNLKK